MSKQFRQIRIDPNSQLQYQNGWSYNLLDEGQIILGIAIYALPGIRFQINQVNNEVPRILTLNTLGTFQMDTENRPVTGLFINEEDCERVKTIYPIIIDLIYEEGGGNA